MELNIELISQTRKLYVAAPLYGGNCEGNFADAMMRLAVLCSQANISMQWQFLQNESLIPRARNYLVELFLQTDCTHFMFIDADIQFDPVDVIAMLQFAEEGSDKDILVGAYPKKNISWEKIKRAVDKGLGDVDPEDLARYAGDFVIGTDGHGEYALNDFIPLTEAGTGFMMIQRSVFAKFASAYPEYSYKPDHKRTTSFNGEKELIAYFQDPIINKRHLSEDYFFCHKAREIGLNVWLCPWMKLNHIGKIAFVGDLVSVIAAGLSATIDPKDIKKNAK